jgi:hypothetical protein
VAADEPWLASSAAAPAKARTMIAMVSERRASDRCISKVVAFVLD